MEEYYSIPYGKGNVTFGLPKHMKVTIIRPRPVSPSHHELREIERALDEPIGTSRLEELKPGKKISIVISDLTRPVPHHLLLPALLKKLDALKIPRHFIKIVIATGQHSKVPSNQFHRLVDPVRVQGTEVICHDPFDHLVYVGKTSRGTPLWVNRTFSQSDFKILTGMIDPHQFVGFTGGSKMASIGLAGLQTIEANHSMFTHPNAQLGKVRGNPVREDIDEMGGMLGIHFILNIVLNEENKVVKAFSGHYLKAWQEGVKLNRSIYGKKVGEKMDLVIASPGGYPKDIDLYQVQKGLAHAAKIVKPGGAIILVGQCVEGIGDDLFFEMVKQSKTPQDVVTTFQSQRFKMGPHKAFLLCRSLIHHKVYFYSDQIPPALIEKFFFTPVSSVQEGISRALPSLPPDPRIAVLPKASSTFFIE
jgi:nickel-dependent lactate racemase